MANRFAECFHAMPLVGIFRGVAPDAAEEVVAAAVGQGLRIVEVPLNSPEALHSIKLLARRFGPEAMVGAGTVTSVAEVVAVAEAGGELIVTPCAREPVVHKARELGLAVIPGAMTPTEIFAMIDCGADAVKIFPAELVPPPGIRALRAVLPPAFPLIPVGGIGPDNMADYLRAGANGFGLGSALYRPGDQPDSVAKRTVELIDCLRRSS